VTYQLVSPEYFGVLGIGIVRGRGFTASERSASAAVAVVSETVAHELWPDTDAVGQLVRLEPAAPDARTPDGLPVARSFRVIGVARDVAGFRVLGDRTGGAGVYLPTGPGASAAPLIVLVQGDVERARRALIDRLAAIDPNMVEVKALRTVATLEAYLLAVPFWLALVLGALALLLTLSGLFSVLSYLVAQRTREIGVRVALGATRRDVAALVLSQLARPVGLGLLLGSAGTSVLGGVILATPAAAAIGETVHFFDPLAYAGALVGVVAACAGAAVVPALRAARTNPVTAIRQD
jgi:hypothetical protein